MDRMAAGVLALTVFLTGSLAAADPPKDPLNYDELFSFPSKIKLDEKQTAALAELRKTYEPSLKEYWELLTGERQKITTKDGTTFYKSPDGAFEREHRQRLIRQITRQKNAVLTEDQKQALGIVTVPAFVQEKALNDPNVWDVGQLEKVYEVQSKSFAPSEDAIYLLVLTKKPWTEADQLADGKCWEAVRQGGDANPRIQIVFYDKNEAKMLTLDPVGFFPAIARTEAKLTEQQADAGLKRYRIKIDLTPVWDSVKDAASVKIMYPQPTSPKDK